MATYFDDYDEEAGLGEEDDLLGEEAGTEPEAYEEADLDAEEGGPNPGAARVTCPYCGEPGEVFLDPQEVASGRGRMVQDCEVCCNPWLVTVYRDEDGELAADVACSQ